MINESLRWLRRYTIPGQGIAITSMKRMGYPEVSGYWIPTLLSVGESDLAAQYARWLCTVQNPDGSFGGGHDAQPFAFDTGQVVRGWVAMIDRLPELEKPLRRACDWLVSHADASTGRLPMPPRGGAWSLGDRGEVNEAIHLYVLPPLRNAAVVLGERRYESFVTQAVNFYLTDSSVTDFHRRNALTHFFAYIQEALVDLGCHEEARQGMGSVAKLQQANGAVPAYADVAWVCSTGLAQLALVWYRLGESDRADRALQFLEQLQNPSGGFYGSYGPGAQYFPSEEISWAAKYVVDASLLRISTHFDRTVDEYRPVIAEQDGRAQAILADLGDLNGKRVLDAGCGKGRYSGLIAKTYPRASVTALDISVEMLKHVPAGIRTVRHSMVQMPFADGSFDAVLCVEALEHVVNTSAALSELVRVLAPGGTLTIIDKNREKKGALEISPWEQWFGRQELTDQLKEKGLDVTSRFVGYDQADVPNGLFISWTGRKPCAPPAGTSVPESASRTVSVRTARPSPNAAADGKGGIPMVSAIRTYDPRLLLGDRLGITLYTLVARGLLAGRAQPVFEWYERLILRCGEGSEHSVEAFRRLLERIQRDGFNPAHPIYANPKEFTLLNGSHRSAIGIALGITELPYHLRFQDNRTPDDVFASLYSASELEALRAEQENLIQECPKEVSLTCRVRRIIRQHEASFAAPFSSKTRLPIVRPYQGSARFGIKGKRPTERRIGAYGLEDILQADFRVLEVGCNCGFLSLEMARMVAHVTGFDADPHYIAIGKEAQAHAGITNCTLQVSKVETFRTDQRYDCIVSCAVHGWVGLSFPQYVQFLLSLMTPSSVLVFESHELDCHPEWEEQKRYLLGSFDILRAGWIDDVDEDVYESELREFLVLKRKPACLSR